MAHLMSRSRGTTIVSNKAWRKVMLYTDDFSNMGQNRIKFKAVATLYSKLGVKYTKTYWSYSWFIKLKAGGKA